MEIYLAESALSDLQDIKDYYSEVGAPEVGIDLVKAILDHVEILDQHPLSGRVVPEFELENLREVIHPPYRVVYLVEDARLSLIRVWRSERLLELPS